MGSWDLSRLPFLHIYAQPYQHQKAEIRGTIDGLRALRAAIDAAIENREGTTRVIATDGEGYHAVVTRVNIVSLVGPLPYTEEPWPQIRHEAWRSAPDQSEWDVPTPGESHDG